MIKKIFLCFFLFELTACARPNIVETPLSRNQVYYGQSVADLYDNFGAPKKAVQYPYGVVEYTFIDENISVENLDKRLLYCNMWVYAQNNRVIDWKSEGNNCHFKEPDPEVIRYLDERRDEVPARITFDND